MFKSILKSFNLKKVGYVVAIIVLVVGFGIFQRFQINEAKASTVSTNLTIVKVGRQYFESFSGKDYDLTLSNGVTYRVHLRSKQTRPYKNDKVTLTKDGIIKTNFFGIESLMKFAS